VAVFGAIVSDNGTDDEELDELETELEEDDLLLEDELLTDDVALLDAEFDRLLATLLALDIEDDDNETDEDEALLTLDIDDDEEMLVEVFDLLLDMLDELEEIADELLILPVPVVLDELFPTTVPPVQPLSDRHAIVKAEVTILFVKWNIIFVVTSE
jgi:hypothetical protein